MKKLILLAGAALLVSGPPALAKPSHAKGHAAHSSHAKANHARSSRGVIVSDRFGRLYALNGHGTCPPGLDKKGNGCMPPGQAKKLYNVGQRYNRNFGTRWTYNQIPDYLRSQYTFDANDRYYYRNGYLYQVDPKTMLIEQVISALLR
jgi:hypothetical protein